MGGSSSPETELDMESTVPLDTTASDFRRVLRRDAWIELLHDVAFFGLLAATAAAILWIFYR